MKENVEVPVEVPEAIKIAVNKILDDIDNKRLESAGVEEQCQSRFSMSWEDVRKTILERVSNGFTLLPHPKAGEPEVLVGKKHDLVISPKDLIKGMHEHAGHFMIKDFLEAIYLSYSESGSLKDKLESIAIKNPDVSTLESEENRLKFLDIANDTSPEKVEEVLKSYGLEKRKWATNN